MMNLKRRLANLERAAQQITQDDGRPRFLIVELPGEEWDYYDQRGGGGRQMTKEQYEQAQGED